jgi:hypothetical protein
MARPKFVALTVSRRTAARKRLRLPTALLSIESSGEPSRKRLHSEEPEGDYDSNTNADVDWPDDRGSVVDINEVLSHCELMHGLLLDTILTGPAGRSYAALLRRFPFPPTWPRVQGPLRYLKSYSMSEHARWSIVIPLLLRCWLRPQHIQPWLRGILLSNGRNSVQRIIECFAAAATRNCVLMGNEISVEDRDQIDTIIANHRIKFQQLLQDAAASATANPQCHRSQEPSQVPEASQAASHAAMPSVPSALAELEGSLEGAFNAFHSRPPAEMAKKAVIYLNDIRRPNMHTALHFNVLADEYGLPVNCSVLQGEDKHKYFKKVIYSTNYHQVEKDLLRMECERQTIRFILTNAFHEFDASCNAQLYHKRGAAEKG